MAREVFRAAALADLLDARAMLLDEREHALAVGAEVSLFVSMCE